MKRPSRTCFAGLLPEIGVGRSLRRQVSLTAGILGQIIEDAQAAGCLAAPVTGLDPNGDGFLAVRTGPVTSYRKIDQLYNGDLVRTCARSGAWVGVYYGKPRRVVWVHGKWLVDSGAG